MLLSPLLFVLIDVQPRATFHRWEPLLQAALLIGIVVVPIGGQAALSLWWLRRRIGQSGHNVSRSLSWILFRALGFWLFFSLLEFAAVFVLGSVAKSLGNPLGYIGFALLGLIVLYVGFGLVIGLLVATTLWSAQRRDA